MFFDPVRRSLHTILNQSVVIELETHYKDLLVIEKKYSKILKKMKAVVVSENVPIVNSHDQQMFNEFLEYEKELRKLGRIFSNLDKKRNDFTNMITKNYMEKLKENQTKVSLQDENEDLITILFMFQTINNILKDTIKTKTQLNTETLLIKVYLDNVMNEMIKSPVFNKSLF